MKNAMQLKAIIKNVAKEKQSGCCFVVDNLHFI